MIDFTCAVCGNDLEVLVCTDGSGFNITPCSGCLGIAVSDGYDKGVLDTQREHDEYI